MKRGGLHEVQVKNMPVACFLARRKAPLFPGAVRRAVNGNEEWLQKCRRGRISMVFTIQKETVERSLPIG